MSISPLALAKSNSVLYGTGTLGLMCFGATGWKSAEDATYSGRYPAFRPLKEFESKFVTKRISNGADNPLDIRAGDCVKRLFPGVPYSRPAITEMANPPSGDHPDLGVQRYPDLSGTPFGCGIIKYSTSSKNNKKAFVYKSEFAAKTDAYGLVLSVGATNLKEHGRIYFEYWLTFLQTEGSAWSVMGSTGWSTTQDSAQSFRGAFFGDNDKSEITIDLLSSEADSTTYTASDKWTTYTYAGFWITSGTENSTKLFFENEGAERKGLQQRGYYSSNSTGPHPLEEKTKFNQRGSWLTQQNYCGGVHKEYKGDAFAPSDLAVRICYMR